MSAKMCAQFTGVAYVNLIVMQVAEDQRPKGWLACTKLLILWTQFSHYDTTRLTATPVELISLEATVGFYCSVILSSL